MSITFQSPLLSYDQVRVVKGMLVAAQAGRKAVLKDLGYRYVEDIPQSAFTLVVGQITKQLRSAASLSK